MMLRKDIAVGFMLVLAANIWSGCQTHPEVMPVSGGYEEVSHPSRTFIALDEPPPPRISFQYRSADGKITPIWESLYGVKEVIKGDLAIFVGDKAYVEPERVTHPRLFAVRSPSLPLDITDEVVSRWAKATGRSAKSAQGRVVAITPETISNGLKIRLEFWVESSWGGVPDNWPESGSIELSWRQLSDIMATVKSKGAEQKDMHWGTPYIAEKPQ